MATNSNADNQSPDQEMGGSLEGVSPQHNGFAPNDPDADAVAYAGLGVNNEPDVMNPGNEEATDTLLYTDTTTARHATDEVPNDEEGTEFDDKLLRDDMSDEDIEEQIDELAEEENEGNERY